jgi:GMP synthase-like glutamine amidotransferase
VKEVLDQRRVRIIAACFGNQIVGRALGARVIKGGRRARGARKYLERPIW